MEIQRIQVNLIKDVCHLLNTAIDEENLAYKHFTLTSFRKHFLDINVDGEIKYNYVAMEKGECIGFINSHYQIGDKVGYITFIVVEKNWRLQQVGTKLLNFMEQKLQNKHSNIIHMEISFFNPINLPWVIPRTPSYDHPNAHGVDVSTIAYLFFKNMRYRDVILQNTYYRQVDNFEYSDIDKIKLKELADRNLFITRYDKEVHKYFDELFEDLGNKKWKEEILQAVHEDNIPMLVVIDGDKVCGFTGPLYVTPNGRGYFTGLGIHSNYRRYGAGRILFASLCKGLKDEGAVFMSLFTGENNHARSIYEAEGFKIVKSWQVMRKELKR
ncbi:MAG: hypothetical protein ATN36_00860 [Epulopiscium sp. Nele67-Bin005]|nr:MAG: hypothetical protein ATN36_00860 [Epulopiscium sp. Nele67-Bin005]